MQKNVNKSLKYTVAAVLSLCNICLALEGMSGGTFGKCSKGLTNPSSTSEAVGRSPLDCIRMCSQTYECSGVNICPDGMSDQFSCGLKEAVLQDECSDLSAASQPSCYYAQRDKPMTTTTSTTATTTPEPTTTLWCRNGGTLNGNQCDCPYQFAGLACERHVRDCSEAYDNGKTDGSTEELTIQPIRAPAPFKVRCQYSWGGTTTLFRWKSSIANFNQDLATLKAGIGNDPMVDNYFVGLDNLYYFTSQADYELNVNVNENNHLYDNVNFGPESSSYAISYDQFRSGTYGDVFAVSPPILLSAEGHDTNNCVSSQGLPGWYGAGCTGYLKFSDGDFDLPISNGSIVSANILRLNCVRQSTTYND